MGSKYQAVKVVDDEKFQEQETFPRRSSTSTSGSTLLEDEEDHRVTELKRRSSGRWIWTLHAALLTLSFTMFVGSYYTRVSTLEYVKKFSAYCELHLRQEREPELMQH